MRSATRPSDHELLVEASDLVEKVNANLQPELMTADDARRLLEDYARHRRLADYGIAALSRKLADPERLARATGTSVGKARETVATGKVLGSSAELGDALAHGDISLDQASEIATAEES